MKWIDYLALLTLLCTVHVVRAQDSVRLKEVNISRKKKLLERKSDRIVFDATQSIAGAGTDALDLLAKVPGVKVTNNQVSLVGKGMVNVMLNDRLIQMSGDDLATYLKSIPSDNVSTIEIITNPPAKYDAQGNNGLLNIVLKKAAGDGLQGAVNMDYSQATHATAGTGLNLNYRKDKVTVYSSFSIRKGSLASSEKTDIFYPDQTWSVLNAFRNFRTVPAGQVTVDYQATKSTSFGITYNGGSTNFHSDEKISTRIDKTSGQLDSVLISDANAKMKSWFNTANLYLKTDFDTTGKQLVFNADWFNYHDDKERLFNNNTYLSDGTLKESSYAQYLSASEQRIDLYTLKADVDLPYKTFKLSLGTKLSFIRNQSDLSFYRNLMDQLVEDQTQSNVFNYKENTQAIYLNFNKKISKLDIQLGLRSEYSQTTGMSLSNFQQDDNRYFQLFPTAFFSYKLNDKNSLALNYGRRINRPPYRKLNPFRWYLNQFSYTEGNPFLKPSFNNNIEFSHSYAGILLTTLSFSHTSQGFSDVNFTNTSSNVQVLRPQNFITSYNYQLSTALTLNPFSWMQNNNQFSLFQNVSKSSLVETAGVLRGAGAYLSTSNQFYLSKDKSLAGDVSFWYQSGGVDGLQRLKSQYNVDAGLRKLLLNKRLQIAASLSDLLKTNTYRYTSVVGQVSQKYENYYDSRKLRLSIRYNFGNDKIKQLSRSSGNAEERKRSN